MYVMGEIGNSSYYIESEKNLNELSKDSEIAYEQYLSGNSGSNAKAHFIGSISQEEYSAQKFQNFYLGKSADGGKNLIRIVDPEKHKAGIDLVGTSEKSESILYVLANQEDRHTIDQINNSVDAQVINEMGKHVKPSCQKPKYRNGFDPNQTKLAGAIFTHYENRSTIPHRHNHITLFNFAEFSFWEDGKEVKKTFAVDTQGIFANQKYFSAMREFLVAQEMMNKLGVSYTRDNDDIWRISGFDTETLKGLSGRRKEIWIEFEANCKNKNIKFSSEAEEEKGFVNFMTEREKARYIESIRNKSKDSKKELNYDELMAQLKDEIFKVDAKLTYEKIKAACKTNQLQLEHSDVISEIKKKIWEVISLSGEMSEFEIKTILYKELTGAKINGLTPNIEALYKELTEGKEPYCVSLKNGKFTTQEVILNSFQALDNVRYLSQKRFYLDKNYVDKFLRKETGEKIGSIFEQSFSFNDGQIEAIRVATDSNSICHITGDAGAGKSTVLGVCSKLFRELGKEVYGLSTQNLTANALKDANIKEGNCFSLDGFFHGIEKGKISFKPGSVLIIDEAGMVGTEHYEKLTDLAIKCECKIILTGDSKQLASVAYGDMFRVIEKELPDSHRARLDETQRQKTEIQKEIAEAFRDRRTNDAVELLKKSNGLFTSNKKKQKDYEEDLLVQLKDELFKGDNLQNKIVIAFKNDDVNTLNDSIRNELTNRGLLNKNGEVSFSVMTSPNAKKPQSRSFVAGDRIVLTGTLKSEPPQKKLPNATRAEIIGISGNIIRCRTLGSEPKDFSFDATTFNKFNHAYAVTTYKSQGQTVDETLIYSDGRTTANQAYVDFSRHRYAAKLFIAESNLNKFQINAQKGQNKANVLESSAAQEFYNDQIRAEQLEKERRIEAARIAAENLQKQKNWESRKKEEEFSGPPVIIFEVYKARKLLDQVVKFKEGKLVGSKLEKLSRLQMAERIDVLREFLRYPEKYTTIKNCAIELRSERESREAIRKEQEKEKEKSLMEKILPVKEKPNRDISINTRDR